MSKQITIGRKSGRPTQQQSQELTRRILDAAEQSFIERGFQETTIDHLSRTLGVTRRSIVSRFGTREDLLYAVAVRDMNTYAPELHAVEVREERCWEDLENLVRKLSERGADARKAGLLRAYLGEVIRLPQLAEAILAFYYEITGIVEQKIAVMQRYGMFRNYKASTVANCAIALVISDPRVRTMLHDPRFDDRITVERHFTDIWTLIRAMA